MRYTLYIALSFFSFIGNSQDITAVQLLENSIQYHDPNNNWETFKGNLKVVMTTPNATDRTSLISINLPSEFFSIDATRDDNTTSYVINKGKCKIQYNNQPIDSVTAAEKNITCDRAFLYKNYYTYLYGLPMKLKDPGTNINNFIFKRSFNGKDYLVLEITYDKNVGTDIWYFYFNPKSFALELYQFFKTDSEGNIIPDSGEYILLQELLTINGIKMPKIRKWYYNKDDKYLGTDTLMDL